MPDNVITRETTITRLRWKLTEFTDAEKSLCPVASERGILCGGFSNYSDEQLRHAYPQIVARKPSISRTDLERAANDWQLRRQVDVGVALACDAQQLFYETCRGWDDFSNAKLAEFCFELLGEEVIVTGERSLPL